MFELLKILHVLALMFGATASLGNLYILVAKGPHDLPAPGFVNKLRLLFRYTALTAITVLFVTGYALLGMRYGWWLEEFAFTAKFTLASLVLAIILWINLLAFLGRKPPSFLPQMHIIGAISLVLAAIFAVIAFN